MLPLVGYESHIGRAFATEGHTQARSLARLELSGTPTEHYPIIILSG